MLSATNHVLRTAVAALCVALLTVFSALQPAFTQPVHLLPEEYLEHQPNEIGRVPVFMYHNIVSNDYDTSGHGVDEYMFRTYDQFWNDMLWLYQNDFYLTGIRDVISGNIDIPAGKHPVVFTFDDASWRHFSMIEDENGELIINPGSAVGLMEAFYAEYPDFGRGAYFAMVPAHKFSWPEHLEDEYFDEKMAFLIENGYEIGNHTLSHPNLDQIDADEFKWTVAEPILWADELMGADHELNAMRVLTLPFGIAPDPTKNKTNHNLMVNGFEYEGHQIKLEGVLRLNGGSSYSRWDTRWDGFMIPRLPVQNDVVDLLKQVYAEKPESYYTSDGVANTVAVPWPLPEGFHGHLDQDALEAGNLHLVRYHPETGEVFTKERKRGGASNIRCQRTTSVSYAQIAWRAQAA